MIVGWIREKWHELASQKNKNIVVLCCLTLYLMDILIHFGGVFGQPIVENTFSENVSKNEHKFVF